MLKRIILNLFVILCGFILPWYILGINPDRVEKIQNYILAIVFVSSVVLTYLNYINLKNKIKGKLAWIIFELVGIMGLIGSGMLLLVIYEFNHGGGF